MQEEKSRAGDVAPKRENAGEDATSKETVSDLERSGEASDSETGSTGSSSAPSPDGQFDTPGRGAGPGDETGPM